MSLSPPALTYPNPSSVFQGGDAKKRGEIQTIEATTSLSDTLRGKDVRIKEAVSFTLVNVIEPNIPQLTWVNSCQPCKKIHHSLSVF